MTTASAPVATGAADTLRRLYAARFVFALVWAVLLLLSASSLGPVTAVLLVLYPVVDVAAAVVDARATRVEPGVYATVAISTLAAVGIVVALASGVPAVLRVWGVWAVVAGLAQLVVALRRRRLGGQAAMIVSGGLSVFAGVAFVVMASSGASLAGLAGYAVLGGIFFLVAALRLGRTAGER